MECRFLALDLLCETLGMTRSSWPTLAPEYKLSDVEVKKITQDASRIFAHEPLQYILGKSPFADLELEVGKGVLIPRPETEELCSIIVDKYHDREGLSFLDVGAGSGAISLALAMGLKKSFGFALEKSPEALPYLRRNFARYEEKIRPSLLEIIEGDLFVPEAFVQNLPPIDILVSNPPYVMEEERSMMAKNVLEWEPSEALFAPLGDPLCYYRAIVHLCDRLTFSSGAILYLEINALLADDTAALFQSSSRFLNPRILKDLSGKKRFIFTSILPN